MCVGEGPPHRAAPAPGRAPPGPSAQHGPAPGLPAGEHWDTTEQMDTYYNPIPHFGYELALAHSPQVRLLWRRRWMVGMGP